ncbi:MAG: DMT family transporter [Pseudomonadota bacterium]
MIGSLSPLTRGTLLFVAAIFLFSIMDAFANHLTKTFHPVQVVWARYAFHVVFSLILLNRYVPKLLRTKYIGQQIIRSAFVFGATISFFFGLFYLTLPQTTAIFEIAPILVTLGAFLVLRERIGPWRWFGVFAGFLGALIIIRPGFEAFSWAALLPVLAAICFAAYAISTRGIGSDESPWTSFLYTALVGTVVVSLFVPFFWTGPTMFEWGQLFAIGAIGALGHSLLIFGLRDAEASALAPFGYFGLVFSMVWGVLFFAEIPDGATLVGAGLVVAAGLLIWWRERRAAPSG